MLPIKRKQPSRFTFLGCAAIALAYGVLISISPNTCLGQSTWVDLFAADEDGNHFSRWQPLGKSEQGEQEILKHWQVTEDGWLQLYQPGNCQLLLKEEIGDFELSFFWKIKTDANNGVKFRVKNYGNQTLGIEYQLLDDNVKKGSTKLKHRTASIYDIVEPLETKPLNVPESINHSRILVRDQKIEHWLNGVKVASASVDTEDWDAAIKKSKFAPHSDFGKNEVGRLLFTDHGGVIHFRDVLLRTF